MTAVSAGLVCHPSAIFSPQPPNTLTVFTQPQQNVAVQILFPSLVIMHKLLS